MKPISQCKLSPDDTASDSAGRYEKLQHTADHKKCPACKEADLKLINIDSDISRLPFAEAAARWQVLRRQVLSKERTIEEDGRYITALNKFFAAIRLCDITPGNLKSYQELRATNPIQMTQGKGIRRWKRPAGNGRINHELCCLSMILQGRIKKGQAVPYPKLWAALKPFYFPLPKPKWSPRDVLSKEDEEELFRVASGHPEAALAYWVACITNNTTATGIELRGLRMKHIFLRPAGEISEIYVPADAVKNDSRPRKISLNRTARWAIEQCYKRALRLGSYEPDHYLFPFCVKHNKCDPNRPASRYFLRNNWDKLRAATGFTRLCPHDLRHQCITRLLERGIHPETVRAIAGHVSPRMMEYYSHIRAEAKYDAVMAIELDITDNHKSSRAVRCSV